MKLYFKNRFGKLEYICETTPDTVNKPMMDDLHRRNPNYKVFYVRSWGDDKEGYTYDIGSWSEHYILTSRELNNIERALMQNDWYL